MKTLAPLKAKPLDPEEEAAWFDGRVARRLLAVPFGGPIPSPKSKRGVDLDLEFFSERTDIFGPYPSLRNNRERLVDFHHSYRPPGRGYGDDTGMMTGHLVGKSILDPEPDEDGWWVDIWLERGNKRVALIERLAQKGAQLFGSSQPMGKAHTDHESGEILLWPFWLETLSTAPQNTYSVLRPKAALDLLDITTGDAKASAPFWTHIEAQLRDLSADLRSTSAMGDDEAKAGRVHAASDMAALQAALTQLEEAMGHLSTVMGRQPDYKRKDVP